MWPRKSLLRGSSYPVSCAILRSFAGRSLMLAPSTKDGRTDHWVPSRRQHLESTTARPCQYRFGASSADRVKWRANRGHTACSGLFGGRIPVKQLDFIFRSRLGGDDHYGAEAIGKVRIACEICAGMVLRGATYAFEPPERV